MRNKPSIGVPGIYTVTHIPSGRVYVGRSTNMRVRWANHRTTLLAGTHWNRALQRAWTKDGPEAFEFAVWLALDFVPVSELSDWLHQSECDAIASFAKTYNRGKVEPTRLRHAPETIALMSRRATARWKDDPEYRELVVAKVRVAAARPESRQRKSESLSELKNRPEEKAKSAARTAKLWNDRDYAERVTAANRATKGTPEYAAAHSVRMKELHNRPERRAALSARNDANWADPAYQEARSAGMTAKWQDPAYQEKQAAGVSADWANPAQHAKRVAALRAASAAPEVKARRSEAMRKRWALRRATASDSTTGDAG